MLPDIRDAARLRSTFCWRIPERYNIGVDCADKWAALDPERPALIDRLDDGRLATVSFGTLATGSSRFANVLTRRGILAGDRVAILLPQSPDVVIAHLGLYKMGALAVPLAALFGPEALETRLVDSGTRAIVTNAAGVEKLRQLAGRLPDLDVIWSVDGPDGGVRDFHADIAGASRHFAPIASTPDTPAMMIYTSGTTGPPKGALHGQRVVLGHLPGVQYAHGFLPRAGDRMWTPADWAWAGGLLNALLPSLSLGVPVVSRRFPKFDTDGVLALIRDLSIRNAFLPPTALRLMKAALGERSPGALPLRSVMTAGETLGPDMFEWGRRALGVAMDEAYGQTECNLVLGSSSAAGISRAGCIGQATPGHDCDVIRADGTRCDAGEEGEIAVRRPDPVMFLGYWRNDAATAAKFVGDWMKTGDRAIRDGDGYVRFVGRDDDIITSAGYRIGPSEIEECLARHPAVAMAAVVGVPDPVRTEIVKAFIVPRPGHAPSDTLAADIKAFVRGRLSAHEYPRAIEWRTELPMTASGKIIRRALRN